MSPDRLERARREIETLRRRGGIRSSDLIAVAKKLGLKLLQRGKEPLWGDPDSTTPLRPIAIPDHPGEMRRFTACSVLDGLEAVLGVRLGEREKGHDKKKSD